MKSLVAALAGMAVVWGVHPGTANHVDLGVTPIPAELQVINRLTDAFNAHDVNAIAALSGDNVEWMDVRGRKLSVNASGRNAVTRRMTRFFGAHNAARCVIEGSLVTGSSVAVRRHIFWEESGKVMSESSLVVYQIANGQVRRAWVYPSGR